MRQVEIFNYKRGYFNLFNLKVRVYVKLIYLTDVNV